MSGLDVDVVCRSRDVVVRARYRLEYAKPIGATASPIWCSTPELANRLYHQILSLILTLS